MKYKIIVDKQPRTNPSTEKKEYEIDIEELRCKGDVADSLIITKDEDYVMRRLSLSEYHVLSVLSEPVKEPLASINIELFEGDNYIYLLDVEGNKFYAEYLVKNDFTDMYVTTNQMNSAINQSAGQIELGVTQKLTEYATSEELEGAVTTLNSTIATKADEINLEVNKKVNNEDLTGANILLKINGDTSEAQIKADKISLTGKTLNLADNMAIVSNNFNVDKNGNMECANGKFNGGQILLIGDRGHSSLEVKESNNGNGIGQYLSNYFGINDVVNEVPEIGIYGYYDRNDNDYVLLQVYNTLGKTEITATGITTPVLTQTSLKSKKKNIEKLKVNALELVKLADICEYNLKSEKAKTKKHIGLVIGEGYNCPNEVISEDGQGIEQYSMTSLLWKAVQEQQEQIEELQNEIKNLKEVQNGKN